MAFFVGGQLVLAAAVVPVERSNSDRERMRAMARRFGSGTLVAIGILFVTGLAMANHYDRWDDTALQAKLGLVVLTGCLIAWHMQRPELRALDGAIFATSVAIVVLGVTVAH